MKKLLLAMVWASFVFAGLSARAQSIENPNNTVVRFDFKHAGTNFGSIDVELFDDEKPETVRNFLLYVHSGGYSNLLLHRLFDQFGLSLMQGGSARVIANPLSTNVFRNFSPVTAFGFITNEVNVEPRRSNLYGTIAMASIAGANNSASTDWYFNLRNNVALDTNFTVFGRVVNTTGPGTGTNLLNYFDAFSRGAGIAAHTTENPRMEFGELAVFPTATGNPNPVSYRDLFTMDIYVIQGAVPPNDTVAPTLVVDLPAHRSTTTNRTVLVSGAANDDQEVARVFYESRYGRFAVDGTTTWSHLAKVLGGTNDLTFYAVDWRGNVSKPVKRTVELVLFSPLTLQTNGLGKIIGVTNGQPLQVGRIYKITAVPEPGWQFLGWNGNYHASTRTIRILMDEEVELVANFYYPIGRLAKGAYHGVFSPDTNGPSRSSGWLTVNLTAGGGYTGRLAPLGSGAGYAIRGKINPYGFSQIEGFLGATRLVLALQVQTNGHSNQIIGAYSDGTFLSRFTLYPAIKFSGGNSPEQQGRYTFLITPPDDHAISGGYGFGWLTLDSRGRFKMNGVLADGGTISQTTLLLRDGRWGFFSGSAQRAVLGVAQFDADDFTFDADVKLFSPNFPGSTNQNAELQGSPFNPGGPLFNWTHGQIVLTGGGLGGPISVAVTSHANRTFEVDSNAVSLQLNAPDANGWIKGSFIHPVTGALTTLQGAVLQSGNMAGGHFISNGSSGSFVVRAP